MATVNADPVRDGSRVKQDRALYRGSGEVDSTDRGIKGGEAKPAKSKIRMDPARALEPNKKKLNSIEAQRIMNVFVDTIGRAKLVSMIPYITQNLAQFEPHFDTELLTLFKQHISIQDCYLEIKEEMVIRLEKRQRRFSEGSQESLDDDGESIELDTRQEYDKDVSINGESEVQSSVRSSVEPDSRFSDRASTGANSETPAVHPNREGEEEEGEEEEEDDRGKDEDNADEQKYEEGEDEEDEEEDVDYKAATELLIRNLSVVAEQLSNSCKNILRAFGKCPGAVTAVNQEFGLMSPAASKYIDFMEEMKGILRCRLLTSPLEERDQAECLKELIQKTRLNEQQIQKLESELAEAIAVKEEETRKKNDIIRRLQEEIRNIDKQSEENLRRVKVEADKQIATELKTSESKSSKIQQELILSRNSLQNLTTDHRNQEMELRRRNYKAETEVENWIQKYDQDMGQLQDEFETIDSIYCEEKKQLGELEEKFATLQKEYLVIIDEREVARRLREESERKMILMVRAATTVQAFWRSFKVRKMLKAKKKKGGSSNGKKKKK